MNKYVQIVSALGFLGLASGAVKASESAPRIRAEESSFIILRSDKQDVDGLRLATKQLGQIWKGFDRGGSVEYSSGSVSGILVDLGVESTKALLKSRLEDPSLRTFSNNGSKFAITVERNGVGSSFAHCGDARLRYDKHGDVDWGVDRVWRGNAPQKFTVSGRAVWIIDSGLATDFPGELSIASRKACINSGCNSDGQKTDIVGHGTMIAGIIGAKEGNKLGVVGVAPGVPVNSLRIVEGSTGEFNFSSLLNALQWIQDKTAVDALPDTPSPGDVINLSLGMPWISSQFGTINLVEAKLRDLADAGYRISVAAGNIDALNGLGYVHAISPARAGSYRPATGKGLIATTSATDSRDWFWSLSAFGNYYSTIESNKWVQRLSLPDYAEPGVDVVTLWPGPDLAKCSGTSVSAAHLSGILLWGDPDTERNSAALYDRSAEDVGDVPPPKPGDGGGYDDTYYDPIGFVPRVK